MQPLRFGVLASGGGSNLQTLMDRIRAGDLRAELCFVASNNSQAYAGERARRAGIPAYHVSLKTEGSEAGVAAKLVSLIDKHPVDLLVLAGYLKKVPDAVLRKLHNRVVNIHPALLPAFGGPGFYGQIVHEAVVRRGCLFTGVTIHMVNEEYDAGQILLQRVVPVLPGTDAEALARRVLAVEHDSYWRVLQAFAEGAIVPTDSPVPGQAVRIDPEWIRRMQALDGTAP
jgi:phosphoribosylglycinamide formyltransferase-1